MQPDAPKVVAFLPHTVEDLSFLRHNGIEHDRFFLLSELAEFEAPHSFEMFTRYGEGSLLVEADKMIPICLDEKFYGLFLVTFFDSKSPIIVEAPASTKQVLEEIKPLLDGGCRPVLFTKMRDPYDASLDQLAQKIILERTIGFCTEDDAVLAQVIAEGRKNAS